MTTETLQESNSTTSFVHWTETRTGKAALTPLDSEMFSELGLTKFCKTVRDLPKEQWTHNPKTKHTSRTKKYHGEVHFDSAYAYHWIHKNLILRLMPTAETPSDFIKVWDSIALHCPETALTAPTAIKEQLQDCIGRMDALESTAEAEKEAYSCFTALLSTLG